jgi:hypothetical protein
MPSPMISSHPCLPTGMLPLPVRDCVVMADIEQTDGFESFRIAVIWRLWSRILVVGDDLFMV